jgi:hypothetical protein
MLESEIVALATQRVNRRNRRWSWWSINLAMLIFSVALMVFLLDTPYEMLGISVMLFMGGLFVPHTILAALAQSRDADIEQEVAHLNQLLMEKPKRRMLNDDKDDNAEEALDLQLALAQDAERRLQMKS